MHGWKRNPKAPTSLWDGLVLDGAYAGLHPGTNRFVDGSGLENHGVLTNMDAASDWVWSEELQQWALSLEKTESEYVGIAAIKSPMLTKMTMAAWLRPDGATGAQYAMQLYSASGFDNQVERSGTSWRFRIKPSGGTVNATASSSVIAGQWQHVAMVYTGSLLVTYVDGIQKNSVAASGTISPTGPFFIGTTSPESATSYHFDGSVTSPLLSANGFAPEEITWLADRSNRMYVPDTRRHFWFPMSRPWLYSEVNHHIGMGLGV